MTELEVKALQYAANKHKGQKRKYNGLPYICHPIMVHHILSEVCDDPEMLAAALLHDTVEDTDATIEEIGELFGPRVKLLVAGLTDLSVPEDGNRAHRKAIDRAHLGMQCNAVKTIKLADIIHNTPSILLYGKGFAEVYANEVKLLLKELVGGNKLLYNEAHKLINERN